MKRRTFVRVGPLAAVVVMMLLSCSPVVRMKVAFLLPAGLKPDPTRLRVTVASSCDPVGSGDRKAAPPPAPEPGPDGKVGATVEGGRLVFEANERSFRCYFHLAAWFDANGNGNVDAGDAVGRMPRAVVSEDRGLCAGNLTHGPDVVLKRVE